MPFPSEFFVRFRREVEFIQKFVHPLLRKLGFSIIADYHGADEFGKDLVFAEIDRFGHIRYHALQVRYVPTLNIGQMADLIESCRQAFANPFLHPHTGQKEVISTFYGLNAGSITANARRHFFASVVPLFHQNARLLDGYALIQLDQWTGAARAEALHARVAGLLNELELNRRLSEGMRKELERCRYSRLALPPADRLFTASIGHYLAEPFILAHPNLAREYALGAARVNKLLDGLFVARNAAMRQRLADQASEELSKLPAWSRHIEEKLGAFMERLGSLATPDEAAAALAPEQGHVAQPPSAV